MLALLCSLLVAFVLLYDLEGGPSRDASGLACCLRVDLACSLDIMQSCARDLIAIVQGCADV